MLTMFYFMGMARATHKKTTVDFGFEDIEASEKTARVRNVFSSVASRYDLMNDAMSFGMHRLWKRELMAQIAPEPGESLLDVAGGTGDVGRLFLEAGGDKATLLDMNENMLRAGAHDMRRICGNAENLPLPSNAFDVVTISFGLRNVTDKDAALSEMTRVLKPGGRFFCLEFCPEVKAGFRGLYDLYSFHAVPWMGEKIAGDAASYQYLIESIRRFPKPESLKLMMEKAGLGVVNYRLLSLGICAIHSGWKA